ncbi:hypothetical protein RUND412_005949 [Rhizina undulata]
MTAPPPPAAANPADLHLLHVLAIVHNNLLNQADWRSLTTHTSPTFPRPLISGIPPEPVYIDPDSAHEGPVAVGRSETSAVGEDVEGDDQEEWVLPVDLREKWTLRKWAAVFDSLPEGFWGVDKHGNVRGKRLLLAVVSEDSTVVYYIVHDGIVKPRQN